MAAPKGANTRPTADRTRETLFSMLVSRIGSFEELRVADLFAGSGALGLEALSRGATYCQFVEQDPAAIASIKANIASLEARRRAELIPASVMTLPAARTPLDLILLDPPYATSAASVALDRLLRLGWIGPATWMVAETGAKESVAVDGLAIETERKVGKAKLTFLRLAEA